MHKKIILLMLMLFMSICLANRASASPLDAHDDVVYTQQETYSSGWVKVSPATEGNYVHDAGATHESSRTNEAYMIGKAPRQEFDYLTAEEQEGIWRYRQKLIEAMRIAALPPAPTKAARTQNMLAKLKWPRVIVDGNAVCVPKLEFSEMPDWGDHLICTDVGTQHD